MATPEEIYEALAAKRKQAQIDERVKIIMRNRRRESMKKAIGKISSRIVIKGTKTPTTKKSKRHKRTRHKKIGMQQFRKSSTRLRAPEFKVKKYGFNF